MPSGLEKLMSVDDLRDLLALPSGELDILQALFERPMLWWSATVGGKGPQMKIKSASEMHIILDGKVQTA